MKDLNQVSIERLPQSEHGHCSPTLKLFLDNWPSPPKCIEEPDEATTLAVLRWRIQILLAVNPYGIPSLMFGEAYKRMWSNEFDWRPFGFETLSEMVNNMPDLFAVQEPDDATAVIFPDYPSDKILHDSRLGHNFSKPALDNEDALLKPTSKLQASGLKGHDFDGIICRAWMERDEEFPEDVVMLGESYEQLMKVAEAKVPGTSGVFQATIISLTGPDSIFIRLNTNKDDQARIRGLSDEIKDYFDKIQLPIDAYNVPREFLLPGFPCLVYSSKEKIWERCVVVSRNSDSKVLVESIDFGGTYLVDMISLYLMPKKFLNIPRQTLQISLVGLKTANGAGRWSEKVGARLRCFSFLTYFLDVLLIEPKVQRCEVTPSSSPRSSPPLTQSGHSEFISKWTSKIVYDALIVDRNDKYLDIYLDEVLILETYAVPDEVRLKEISELKKHLQVALKDVPKPQNPFEIQT